MTPAPDAPATPVLPVEHEPFHRELLREAPVRVYEATLDPGATTLDHHHVRDTRYVVTAGGGFRSQELGRPQRGTRIGRGTPRRAVLRWALGRLLRGGWVDMPRGTVLHQPHARRPIAHRVSAHPRNAGPVRLLGVEVDPPTTGAATPVLPPDPRLVREHEDPGAAIASVTLQAGYPALTLRAPRGLLVIILDGALAPGGRVVVPGRVLWFDASTHRLLAAGPPPASLVLMVV